MRLRGRAYTRHQRERIIQRRMRHFPTWELPRGRFAKWNGTCSCWLCKFDKHGDMRWRRRWKREAWREIEPAWMDHQEYLRQLRWWERSSSAACMGPAWLAQVQEILRNEILGWGPTECLTWDMLDEQAADQGGDYV